MEKPTKRYLRTLYLDAVRDTIEFYDAGVLHQFEWDNASRRILATLLSLNIIDEKSLLEAIHDGIIRTAKELYESHISLGTRVDHSGAQALAYALHHKAFTEDEVARIDFDRVSNSEAFVRGFLVKNMPKLLLTELTTERVGGGLELVHHQS